MVGGYNFTPKCSFCPVPAEWDPEAHYDWCPKKKGEVE